MPSRDSSYTYLHFHKPHHAELFDDHPHHPHLPPEDIYVPPEHQPTNPEDEDGVVPDQHAAFGIQQATQRKKKAEWKDFGLEELMRKGPNGKDEVNGVKSILGGGSGVGGGGSAVGGSVGGALVGRGVGGGVSAVVARRGWGSVVLR